MAFTSLTLPLFPALLYGLMSFFYVFFNHSDHSLKSKYSRIVNVYSDGDVIVVAPMYPGA